MRHLRGNSEMRLRLRRDQDRRHQREEHALNAEKPLTADDRTDTAEQRLERLRRALVYCVVWFFAWPAIAFGSVYVSGFRFPEGTGAIVCVGLLLFGTYVWMFSCHVIYDALFEMAAARWPAAKTVRELISLAYRMLRAFGHHH